MEQRTLTARFTLGEELTHHELKQVYVRITGRPLPSGRHVAKVAQQLSANWPLRFEFEVNRLRGYAWDAGECVDK